MKPAPIDCQYLQNCVRANTKDCEACCNNKNHKKDYYNKPEPTNKDGKYW